MYTPIKLAFWDHLVEISRLLNLGVRDWSFFKADHEADYKQLPVKEEHSKLAVIALRNPVGGQWYGFFSRTLMFGAISAVLHYNLFSRLLTELVNRIFGIPLICFFDDFGAMAPAELAPEALHVFTLFCTKLGITLKTQKSELGQTITFLGLSGSFPTKSNNWTLLVSPPPEKVEKWTGEIRSHIRNGLIPAVPLEKLIGKLGFSQTNLFGKFARAQLRPLYQKLYTKPFSPTLTSGELRTFHWWADILSSLHPRIPRGLHSKPDLVVYTDAATTSNKMAAIALKLLSGIPVITQLVVSSAPCSWLEQFPAKNLIMGCEMLAPLA